VIEVDLENDRDTGFARKYRINSLKRRFR